MTTTNTNLHPFESAGLGIAPFSHLGMSENVYSVSAPANGAPGLALGERKPC